MNLVDFVKEYGDEATCKAHFKQLREKAGICCRKCKSTNLHWLKDYDRCQCRGCGAQTSLRSGTLLELSKLPYHYWFYALYMMSSRKKSISAMELQRQLGHKRYEPVWQMMHKIRRMMGRRDSAYQLQGLTEIDDAFITVYQKQNSSDNQDDSDPPVQKRGRGSQRKRSIIVMAKTAPGKPSNKNNSKPTAFEYVKMKVVDNLRMETVDKVTSCIDQEATVVSDNMKSFKIIATKVKEHHAFTLPKELSSIALPWVHIMVANLKRNLLGIHHSIKDKWLQVYLDEYCYKTNRRNFKMKVYDRTLVAAIEAPWYA